ncbi:MAG: hypothetical protein HYS53_02535 [Candidatus Aenigmarchaeota archaeon]|nr:hypothetical protein [Candidatus Aenigmarchaeota archaeon]
MPEREINLATVVVIGVVLLAVILGIVFVFVIPNLNSAKQGGNLEFACATYQGGVGCANSACGVNYEETACKKVLDDSEITLKGEKINLWEQCNKAGITDPKNCQIRCCGVLAVGVDSACGSYTVKCATGLKCDDSAKKCVKA